MKTLIEKIEALRVTDPVKGAILANIKLDQALDILRAENVIKAKSLRDKTTKEWITIYIDGDFLQLRHPIFPNCNRVDRTLDWYKNIYSEREIDWDNIELIEIEIHIPE